jgi:hypothetical protein
MLRLHYTGHESNSRDILGPFVSYEEDEVLVISLL